MSARWWLSRGQVQPVGGGVRQQHNYARVYTRFETEATVIAFVMKNAHAEDKMLKKKKLKNL